MYQKWFNKLSDFKIKNKVISCIGEFSPSGIGLLLASIANNNVFVPISKDNNFKDKILEISEADILVDLHKDNITFLTPLHNNSLILELITIRKNPGLILFSSGTTGIPKGSIHDFIPLLEKYSNNSKYKYTRSIAFLLFDHIGGINTVLYNIFSMSLLVVPSSRSPDYILSLIEKYRIELLPTTPSFLNLILINKTYEKFDLSSLKTISYGTEPMPESTLELLSRIFPNIVLKQTYGLTELGIIRTKSEQSNSLWIKIGDEDHQVQIRDDILWVKSKMSMLGYLNADSPFDKEGWFNTKDRVEIKGEYIKILGRDSELINVGGLKVFPAEVENIILQVNGVLDVVAYGYPNPLMGKVVGVKVHTKSNNLNELRRSILQICYEKLEKFKRPVKILFVNEGFQSERLKKKRL